MGVISTLPPAPAYGKTSAEIEPGGTPPPGLVPVPDVGPSLGGASGRAGRPRLCDQTFGAGIRGYSSSDGGPAGSPRRRVLPPERRPTAAPPGNSC
jgi:hypothetical protein